MLTAYIEKTENGYRIYTENGAKEMFNTVRVGEVIIEVQKRGRQVPIQTLTELFSSAEAFTS